MSANIKCVVVGDGTVGKTCFLMSYCHNQFPLEYVPTIFETDTVQVSVGEENATLLLFDTAGQEDYDRLRILSYPGTDVFLLCFSVVCESSLANVEERWIPELRSSCGPEVPIILVGTKTDLRMDAETIEGHRQQKLRIITREEGSQLAKRIGAHKYLECSAITRAGLNEIFVEAILAVIDPNGQKADTSCCALS